MEATPTKERRQAVDESEEPPEEIDPSLYEFEDIELTEPQ